MKRFLSVLLVLLLALAAPAVAAEADAPARVAALKGPTAMGMAQLIPIEGEVSEGYEFTIAAAVDEITPQIVQGNLDISAIPANLASILYNNTEGQVRVLAINTLGVLYIVERGEALKSVEDLRGKTIYASGKGATPEYALNYVLAGNGIDPETDVTIEWKAEHTECLSALLADESAIAMLPQPFVTTAIMQEESVRMALDLSAEWDALQEGEEAPSAMVTGVVVARAEFIEEYPEKVEAFLDAYAQSVAFVNENVAEAAQRIGALDIVPAAVAEKALPYCNIVFIEGEEMQLKLGGYLAVLFEQNPEAIGGAMPDEAFYYQR